MLLLPSSLRKLAKSFSILGVEAKSIFPYTFVNNISTFLSYQGDVPPFSFFDKVTEEEYNIYKANFINNWSLKDETIKYCILDCVILHQILVKFNSLIFNRFNVTITKYPTESKRAIIYNDKGIASGTKSYIITYNKEIT